MNHFSPLTHGRAVFLDFETVDFDNDLDRSPLSNLVPHLEFFDNTTDAQLADRLLNAEIILTNSVGINASMISNNPHLKFIGLTATGFNHIDIEAAKEHAVAVTNLKDYCTQSVVQHAFSGFLSLNQKLNYYHSAVKSGQWNPRGLGPIRELQNLTMGIIGHGVLGSAMQDFALKLGMRVMVAAHPDKPASPGELPLDEVLMRSDVLSLHIPLNDRTRGLLNETKLRLMRPHAILINVARGAVVDNDALARVLRDGHLGGAFIDVFDSEPPPVNHPLVSLDLPNVIVSPHMAWGSFEARQRAINELAANLASFYRGKRRLRVV